ncbi:MAG: MFS transporter [Candidatus Micrarchaeota archaeon]
MRRSTLGLILTLLFGFSFNGLLATALPLYLRDKGVSIVEIGMIFSAYYFVTQLLRILIGAIADRVGTRSLIRISGLTQALTVLVYFFSPFSSFFLIGKILEGISASFVRAIDKAIVYSGAMAEKRDIGKVAGSYSVFLWTGIGTGSFVAGVLIGFGYEYVFGLLVAISLSFVAISYLEPKKEKESLNGVFAHAFDWGKMGDKLRRITIIRTLEGFAWTLTTSFLLVIILKEFYGLSTELVGALLLLIYLMRAAAGYSYGQFISRFDAKSVFVACTLLSVIASCVAALVLSGGSELWYQGGNKEGGFLLFSVAIIANVVFMGIRAPAINKVMVLAAHKKELGKEISYSLLGYWVGMGLGDCFSGALADAGSFALPYFLASLAQLILAWAIWRFV